MKPPFIIVNPAAGSIENLDVVMKKLQRLRPQEICVTRRAGEAEILAQKAVGAGCEFLVAAGGDGTLNEVVNAIARSRRARQVSIGVVPLGTGNDFARMLDLPKTIEDTISILRTGRTTLFDVIRVQSDRVRYFANVSTGGFSGAVDQKLTSRIKRTWGPLAYVRSAAAALPRLHPYHVTITVGQREKLSVDLYNVIVANGRFVASGLPIAPEADPGDGLLDVILIPACSAGEMALLAGQILLGKHLHNERIIFRRVNRITIRSRPKMRFNVDGEPVGRAPIVFQIVPKALSFVTSK